MPTVGVAIGCSTAPCTLPSGSNLAWRSTQTRFLSRCHRDFQVFLAIFFISQLIRPFDQAKVAALAVPQVLKLGKEEEKEEEEVT